MVFIGYNIHLKATFIFKMYNFYLFIKKLKVKYDIRCNIINSSVIIKVSYVI